jgi:hypothetical protein
MSKDRADIRERLRWCSIFPINREQERILVEAEDAFDAEDYNSANNLSTFALAWG